MKYILFGVTALLVGCKDDAKLLAALIDVEKKCAVPVGLSVTYQPTLFSNGSLTVTCPKLKPDTLK